MDDARPGPDAAFARLLERWRLDPDGPVFAARSGRLMPVLRDGAPAMLKLATEPEERLGGCTMVWWAGDGAARVLEHDGDALLMERASGERSLAAMALGGRDDEASRILCAVADRLHAPRAEPPPEPIPLDAWFRELSLVAEREGGVLGNAAATARALLAEPQEVAPLHGDLHHGNVLDFGLRGWLAIDPKGLVGERGFDYANIFCNPEEGGPAALRLALAPGRLARQAHVVAEAARLDRPRLLRWILAYAGLSAAWFIGDGDCDEAALPLAVAERAAAEIALE